MFNWLKKGNISPKQEDLDKIPKPKAGEDPCLKWLKIQNIRKRHKNYLKNAKSPQRGRELA